SGITAIEGLLGGLDDFRPGSFRLRHYFINFFFAYDVMGDSEFGCACGGYFDIGIMGEAFARPEGKFHAVFQVEENDSAILKLFPDDSFRIQSEAIAIEPE